VEDHVLVCRSQLEGRFPEVLIRLLEWGLIGGDGLIETVELWERAKFE